MFHPALPLSGLRVFVVDSDPDARYLLTTLFTAYGVETFTAGSVAAAIALLQQTTPDLLISEINLPDEDGYSFMRRVKALEIERQIEIPAVALTVFASPGDRTHALAAGFRQHLPKPVDIDRLIATAAGLAATAASLSRPVQILSA